MNCSMFVEIWLCQWFPYVSVWLEDRRFCRVFSYIPSAIRCEWEIVCFGCSSYTFDWLLFYGWRCVWVKSRNNFPPINRFWSLNVFILKIILFSWNKIVIEVKNSVIWNFAKNVSEKSKICQDVHYVDWVNQRTNPIIFFKNGSKSMILDRGNLILSLKNGSKSVISNNGDFILFLQKRLEISDLG